MPAGPTHSNPPADASPSEGTPSAPPPNRSSRLRSSLKFTCRSPTKRETARTEVRAISVKQNQPTDLASEAESQSAASAEQAAWEPSAPGSAAACSPHQPQHLPARYRSDPSCWTEFAAAPNGPSHTPPSPRSGCSRQSPAFFPAVTRWPSWRRRACTSSARHPATAH